MNKWILVINGHPNKEAFNFAIMQSYLKGANDSGAEVKSIIIADLNFNPNLEFGYQKRSELEPDLLDSWEKIQWAHHIVWIHPVWWGGLPAITKGFIDRLFLPGMAFKYRDNSVWWDKLLKGKTAHILSTMDTPTWYYRFIYGNPSVNQLKKTVLNFCGIKPVRVSHFTMVKGSTTEKRKKWLQKVYSFGLRNL